ncbi:hypothetical protein L1887_43994 [Cichorium endivia]|nr:hypothetical protein L1887_43994 [Cichorium endivia]
MHDMRRAWEYRMRKIQQASINRSPAAELESASASNSRLSQLQLGGLRPCSLASVSNRDDARGARRSGNQLANASHTRPNSRQPIFPFLPSRLPKHAWTVNAFSMPPLFPSMPLQHGTHEPCHVLLPRCFSAAMLNFLRVAHSDFFLSAKQFVRLSGCIASAHSPSSRLTSRAAVSLASLRPLLSETALAADDLGCACTLRRPIKRDDC